MYPIALDLWKGDALKVDYPTLYQNGAHGFILRLNTIDGVLVRDSAFDTAWQKAKSTGAAVMPYLVYSPWHTPKDQVAWMVKQVPAGIKAVALDVELKGNLAAFSLTTSIGDVALRLRETYEQVHIYSGAWFWNALSRQEWMKKLDYWWARYPYAFYPSSRTEWTWETLTNRLSTTVFDPGNVPGVCKLWQVSGDRLILPGTGGEAVDVNIFNGSENEMYGWFGCDIPTQPTELSDHDKLEILWNAHKELHS